MSRSPRTSRPLLALLLGALALAAGVVLARAWLPEWQPGLLDESFYTERYRELAGRAGVRLLPGAPRISLTGEIQNDDALRKELDLVGPDRASALGMGLRIEASQLGRAPGEPTPRRLGFELSPAGSPLTLSWLAEGDEASKSKEVPQERAEALARLLLAPGERLGQRSAKKESSYPILGSDPPQSIVIAAPSDSVLRIRRDSAPRDSQTDTDNLPEVLILVVPIILGVLTVLWLFLRLLYRQRIDFVNGLFLAGLSLAVVALGAPARIGWRQILGPLVPAAFLGLWIVLVWASSESFLRAVRPGFTTSLDLLRARRLGPRGGRALLYGMGLGAALGGLRLALLSGASALPGVWLRAQSVHPHARGFVPCERRRSDRLRSRDRDGPGPAFPA